MPRHLPAPAEFDRLASAHVLVPVYRRLVADALTPVAAFLALPPAEWAFLFESVVGGERLGRYSFLGSRPLWVMQAYGNDVSVEHRDGSREQFVADDPLAVLEERLKPLRAAPVKGLPLFLGGAVGFAGYDTVRYVEKLPPAPPDDRHLPDLCFGLYERVIVFDHIQKIVNFVQVARVDPDEPEGWADAHRQACSGIDELVAAMSGAGATLTPTDIDPAGSGAPHQFRSNFTQPQFEAAVVKCQEYINAGDIFQVVLSQRLEAETSARPIDIYRALRVVNPSPFMFLLRCARLTLVGASPEIMTRVHDNRVTVRPLAGTRRRGATEQEDLDLERELLADPKERAEHIMLVDLGRNDVGRVAKFGSVSLPEEDLMIVERYSHVMHISSSVSGELDAGKTPFDALRACLPAGTLSGAPKIRAMEVINELEPHRRGPYGGAVGYVDFLGNMDTCIALRTMVLVDGVAYIQAGAGLVADSEPASEYLETMNKAMGLLKAVEVAETQLSGMGNT